MSAKSTDYITTGGGKLYLALFNDDGTTQEERYFGVTDNVTLSVSSEYVEKPYTEEAVQSIAKRVLKKQSGTLKFATSEISPDMLARAYGGEIFEEQQQAVSDTSVTVAEVKKGGFYDLGYLDITSITVDGKTEGTDYRVDKKSGRLEVLEGGSINDGDTLNITLSANAVKKIRVEALTKGTIEAKMVFISEPLVGKRFKYTFNKVAIGVSGDFDLKSDDFSVIEFEGGVNAFDTGEANKSKFYTIEEIPA